MCISKVTLRLNAYVTMLVVVCEVEYEYLLYSILCKALCRYTSVSVEGGVCSVIFWGMNDASPELALCGPNHK